MFSSKPEAVIWFYTQPRWSEVHNDDNCYFLSEVVVDKENKKEVSVSNNNNNWNNKNTKKNKVTNKEEGKLVNKRPDG